MEHCLVDVSIDGVGVLLQICRGLVPGIIMQESHLTCPIKPIREGSSSSNGGRSWTGS